MLKPHPTANGVFFVTGIRRCRGGSASRQVKSRAGAGEQQVLHRRFVSLFSLSLSGWVNLGSPTYGYCYNYTALYYTAQSERGGCLTCIILALMCVLCLEYAHDMYQVYKKMQVTV